MNDIADSDGPVTRELPTGRRTRRDFADAWEMLLSNHGRVLTSIGLESLSRLRDLAMTVDITEQSVFSIVEDLQRDGYIVRTKVGRRNSYTVNGDRVVVAGHPCNVGDLVRLFTTRAPDGVPGLRSIGDSSAERP